MMLLPKLHADSETREVLERLVLGTCMRSMHLALLLHWHLRGYMDQEDERRNLCRRLILHLVLICPKLRPTSRGSIRRLGDNDAGHLGRVSGVTTAGRPVPPSPASSPTSSPRRDREHSVSPPAPPSFMQRRIQQQQRQPWRCLGQGRAARGAAVAHGFSAGQRYTLQECVFP